MARATPLTFIVAALSVVAPSLAALLLWFGRRSGRERDR